MARQCWKMSMNALDYNRYQLYTDEDYYHVEDTQQRSHSNSLGLITRTLIAHYPKLMRDNDGELKESTWGLVAAENHAKRKNRENFDLMVAAEFESEVESVAFLQSQWYNEDGTRKR